MDKLINGLKKCPFCAKQPNVVSFSNEIHSIVCKCGAESPKDSSGNNYIWNGIDGKDKGWLNYRTFNLMEELEKRGYDLKTLKFSIKLKQELLTNKGESRKK